MGNKSKPARSWLGQCDPRRPGSKRGFLVAGTTDLPGATTLPALTPDAAVENRPSSPGGPASTQLLSCPALHMFPKSSETEAKPANPSRCSHAPLSTAGSSCKLILFFRRVPSPSASWFLPEPRLEPPPALLTAAPAAACPGPAPAPRPGTLSSCLGTRVPGGRRAWREERVCYFQHFHCPWQRSPDKSHHTACDWEQSSW